VAFVILAFRVSRAPSFFLKALDDSMERLRLFYLRFMDDIVVLAPTRRGSCPSVVTRRPLPMRKKFEELITSTNWWVVGETPRASTL